VSLERNAAASGAAAGRSVVRIHSRVAMTSYMRNLHLALVVGLSINHYGVWAQSDYRNLPRDFNEDHERQMMRSYLRKQVHEALDHRLDELDSALGSADLMAAYLQKRRAFLRWTLGEMPQRTPLNDRTTRSIECDDFIIEMVLFESQPGFHVTGNLYRPRGSGPFPAILHSCGHHQNGKAASEYQKANGLLAKHGFLVLCYDPIGQAERQQILDLDGKSTRRATDEHQQLGVAPILLGRSLATYMVWDAVRAIDYLQSRSDVDPERIGCVGNSGGGNLTSYIMAYDERVSAAAVGCLTNAPVPVMLNKTCSPRSGTASTMPITFWRVLRSRHSSRRRRRTLSPSRGRGRLFVRPSERTRGLAIRNGST
jgi:hypothetical protein